MRTDTEINKNILIKWKDIEILCNYRLIRKKKN